MDFSLNLYFESVYCKHLHIVDGRAGGKGDPVLCCISENLGNSDYNFISPLLRSDHTRAVSRGKIEKILASDAWGGCASASASERGMCIDRSDRERSNIRLPIVFHIGLTNFSSFDIYLVHKERGLLLLVMSPREKVKFGQCWFSDIVVLSTNY
jgi:hypothetical protein